MIGYVTLGTNDLEAAAEFYDSLFDVMGATRFMEGPHWYAWGFDASQPSVALTRPFDQKKATAGNGTMVALAVDSPEMVQKLHARAMALGATDEGAPGDRGEGFYAGYFRDLDGNKFNAFCMLPQS